jgi:hypothetical protein
MTKRVLVTFSSKGWEKNAIRFSNEAKELNEFSDIISLGESDLTSECWPCEYRQSSERGFGYWTWKPVACLKAIKDGKMDISVNSQDLLIWADTGCTFVKTQSAIKKLQNYFYLALHHSSGWLAFYQEFLESSYTKGDVFERLNGHKYANSHQIWAGCFFMRTTPENVYLLEKWKMFCEEPHLVDDSQSEYPNYKEFIENRHDQSILSLLLKKNNAQIIPDECDFLKSLLTLQLQSVPILSTRITKNCLGPGCMNIKVSQIQNIIIFIYVILGLVVVIVVLKKLNEKISLR